MLSRYNLIFKQNNKYWVILCISNKFMFIDYGACAVDNREQILCDVLKFEYHSISGKQRIILSHRQSTQFDEWKKQQYNDYFSRPIKSFVIRIKGY